MSFASQTGQWTLLAPILPVVVDAAVKSALVLIAAGVAVGCMRKCSAAARHLVWFLAVASLPLLPALSLALPGWHILPQWFNVSKLPTQEQRAAPIVEAVSSSPAPVETAVPVAETPATPSLQPSPISSREGTPFRSPAPPTMASAPAPHDRIDPLRLALPVWLAGAALAFLPTALGLFSLRRLERSSRRETASSWLELLRRLVDRLKFKRAVVLLKTNRRRMPMTWGIFRPKLLLPDESQQWTENRRHVVLLHELAHAKRWDYLTNLVTQFVCALYWFNPLVWFAARQMIAERERACDDIVLRHGAKPADYAEQILQIAAGLRLERWAGYGGIAMARPSKLEGRLRAILDAGRNRAALTRFIVLVAIVLLVLVIIPVAMMKAVSGETSNRIAAGPTGIAPTSSPPAFATSTSYPRLITGQVVDADMQKPIPEFTVTPGSPAAVDLLNWDRAKATDGKNGAYELSTGAADYPTLILVEAPGYAPEMAAIRTNSILDFQLRKDGMVEGTVLDPTGRPLANAQVLFQVKYSLVHLESARFRDPFWIANSPDMQRSPESFTDGDGKFSLPATAGAVAFLAVHESGFAEQRFPRLPLGSNATIRLRPWARIEGTLLRGAQPLTNDLVGLSTSNYWGRGFELRLSQTNGIPSTTLRANTDDSGRFIFDHVPPGDFWLDWTDPITGKRTMRWPVKTEAGKTAVVELNILDSPRASTAPSVEISLGIRKTTGIEFRQKRQLKYPLEFRIKNIGQTNLSGGLILQMMMSKAAVHARSAEGVEQEDAFRPFWDGPTPRDLSPGDIYVDSTYGDLLSFFPSATNGVYEVWWTLGDLKSNRLRFNVAKEQITLITDPMSGNSPAPPTNSSAGSSAEASNISYAAGFAPEKSEVMIGETIYLEFNLTNTGRRTLLLHVGGDQWGLAGPYRIRALDRRGYAAPDPYGDGMFASGGPIGATAIEPGQVFTDRLLLPTFVPFEQPGDYTVIASRKLFFYDESVSTNHRSRGAISSDGGLHWVNVIDDLKDVRGDRGSTLQITNRFKLTVQPMDKERLLGRAGELVAKLGRIGADDLRVNPDPPRPLDLNVDWSVMASAWLFGKNNEDLRWTVRELSDVGDRRIIPELKQHLADPNMKVRFACVKVLCALGEPLRAEWIVPIIKSRRWTLHDDPEMFVKDHGGAEAADMLIDCLDMSNASVTDLWNFRLLNTLRSIGNPELNFSYHHDEKRDGTPLELHENAATLAKLKDWRNAHRPNPGASANSAAANPPSASHAANLAVAPPPVSVRERIEQFIRGAPSTTNLDLEIWEPGARNAFAVRSNVVQLGYYNESGLDSNSVFGMVYRLPAQNRFYIGWGEFRNGPNRYYGPFRGNPFDVLGGPNGSGWKKTAHSPDPKRIEPDNPLGLDDETIVRLFRLGKKLQQIAWGAALPPRNSNIAFHSVEEVYANNINRDELTSDPFGSGPLRLEWREGKVRIYSVGPDGEWNRGELIEPGDAELKGDLGVEIEIGRIDIHWLAEGAMLDYLQGKHTARYLAKKGTHYAVQFPLPQWAGEKLQFGPMVDGLRAAVELTTTNGEFAFGQPIEVRFHIRNEADYDIQIASDSWRQGDEAMIEDEQGRRAPVGKSWYSGESPTQREVLKPGQSATFKSSSLEFFPRAGATDPLTAKHPVGYTARVAPGKCTVRFRLRFPGWTAQFMDWRGELETGPVVIDLKPASENSLGPQTPSQQSIAHSALSAFFAVKSTPDCP